MASTAIPAPGEAAQHGGGHDWPYPTAPRRRNSSQWGGRGSAPWRAGGSGAGGRSFPYARPRAIWRQSAVHGRRWPAAAPGTGSERGPREIQYGLKNKIPLNLRLSSGSENSNGSECRTETLYFSAAVGKRGGGLRWQYTSLCMQPPKEQVIHICICENIYIYTWMKEKTDHDGQIVHITSAHFTVLGHVEGTPSWKCTGQLFLSPSNRNPIWTPFIQSVSQSVSHSPLYFNSFSEKSTETGLLEAKVHAAGASCHGCLNGVCSLGVSLSPPLPDLSGLWVLTFWVLFAFRVPPHSFRSFRKCETEPQRLLQWKASMLPLHLAVVSQSTLWDQLCVPFIEAECHLIKKAVALLVASG